MSRQVIEWVKAWKERRDKMEHLRGFCWCLCQINNGTKKYEDIQMELVDAKWFDPHQKHSHFNSGVWDALETLHNQAEKESGPSKVYSPR